MFHNIEYTKNTCEKDRLTCTVCSCRVRQEMVGLNQLWETEDWQAEKVFQLSYWLTNITRPVVEEV